MTAMTDALRSDYASLFDTCQIRPERQQAIEAAVDLVVAGADRYRAVAATVAVPWYVIGVLHSLECGSSFACHLHNGDPLSARTCRVPAGRPIAGAPPFDWTESAIDALTFEGYASWTDWSVPGILYKWESYNGMGYRLYHPEVKTPYLWSFTNHYTTGKYGADGVFDPTLESQQAGAAALLRRLAELGYLDAATSGSGGSLPAGALSLRYDPADVTPGGAELQHYLNGFPGVFLREDGLLGDRTSDAFKQVCGHYLLGDPRA